jgi:N-methylhydantoinase B
MHVMWVAGGSGYGDPVLRDPGLVERDVRAGLCSARDAEEVYAVSLRNGTVDRQATARRREALMAWRLERARPVAELIEQYGTVGVSDP